MSLKIAKNDVVLACGTLIGIIAGRKFIEPFLVSSGLGV